MAAIHRVQTKGHKRASAPRKQDTRIRSPHAQEIDWKHVSPTIESAKRRDLYSFVYFIGEQDGPGKIGHAKDPIRRIRELQIGNPRPLRVERLIFGYSETEAFLHAWTQRYVMRSAKPRSTALNATYRPDTEWFTAECRSELFPVLEEIAALQLAAAATRTLHQLHNIAADTLINAGEGINVAIGDTFLQLARGSGYVATPLRATRRNG